MPQATCTPGQGDTKAIAPALVILTPNEGNFPDDAGTVDLISNDNHEPAGMVIAKWETDKIEALLPWPSPGTGDDAEMFTVEARSDGITYQASPVRVEGPPGSGYPPTHPL